MRFSMRFCYRVFCCDNAAFSGDNESVVAKHSKNFNLIDSFELGLAQMQSNFEAMVKSVEIWRQSQITGVTAKLRICEVFL